MELVLHLTFQHVFLHAHILISKPTYLAHVGFQRLVMRAYKYFALVGSSRLGQRAGLSNQGSTFCST